MKQELSSVRPDLHDEMYELAIRLFPITRSITGDGIRQTLRILREVLPDLTIHEVPSGTEAFDWVVPDEWGIHDAYILDEAGNKIVDFRENNLHVVSYSTPVDTVVSLAELEEHLFSLPEQPDAIPYVTSYYSPRWGFCISHKKRQSLKSGQYRVLIDSELKPGHLTYGEMILPGEESDEILLSTYICHPSMANNELSGPVVTAFLARWLAQKLDRKYTYRIVFVPETIGSIVYLSKNLQRMKDKTLAGFVVTCVGDERAWSFMPSRLGNTIVDRVSRHILRHHTPSFVEYSFLQRGSDERQYCSPRVDLPVVSIMRSKYGTYPEYHTSLDNLSLITPVGLGESYEVYQRCLCALERNDTFRTTCYGEPQLGKRGLYPTLSTRSSGYEVRDMMNLLAYSDGAHDLIDIVDLIDISVEQAYPIVDRLLEHQLLERIDVIMRDTLI